MAGIQIIAARENIPIQGEIPRGDRGSTLSHELIVLDLIVGQRVADRQLARDKRFREQRPEWRPIPDEHWQREILAAKRISKALEVLYG